MKQKDIALIVVIAVISTVFAFIIASLVMPSSSDRATKVEVVEPISAKFDDKYKKYFNSNSINPTQTVQIGNNTNPQPFN